MVLLLKKLHSHGHQSQSNGFAVSKESVSRIVEVVGFWKKDKTQPHPHCCWAQFGFWFFVHFFLYKSCYGDKKRSLTPTAAGHNFVYVFLVLSNFVFTSRAVEIQFCDFFFLVED